MPPASAKQAHILNTPSRGIDDALAGLTRLRRGLRVDTKHRIVYREDLPDFSQTRVCVVGFGGGGHEPMFSNFVSHRLLSGHVSGHIFASPTAAQLLAAIRLCQRTAAARANGTLLVCGNYTGDILNAGLALVRARAEGFKVAFAPVGDDVAVGRGQGGKVGRRGLSGYLVALKIVCGMAEEGASLEGCVEGMAWVCGGLGTVGVGFDRVSLPSAHVAPLPQLPAHTIELGMGAHGEPGLEQLSPAPSPAELTARMVSLLTDTTDADRSFIPFTAEDDGVILLVNSLGGTSDAVLSAFAGLAVEELEKCGLKVLRLMLGPFVTSLKSSGFSLTVWRVPREGEEGALMARREALRLWDERVGACAWRQ